MSYGNIFGQPRLTTNSANIVVDNTSAVSSSIFQITGGPVAVRCLYGEIKVAFPNANVQFKLVGAPTGTPTPVINFCTQTSTFGTQWKVNGKFILHEQISQPMQSSDIVIVVGVPNFSRIIAPGIIYHVNENSAGGTPAQMRYNILWSPMGVNSNVQGL